MKLKRDHIYQEGIAKISKLHKIALERPPEKLRSSPKKPNEHRSRNEGSPVKEYIEKYFDDNDYGNKNFGSSISSTLHDKAKSIMSIKASEYAKKKDKGRPTYLT